MPPRKYPTKAEYILAIRDLHQRAKRSGWDLETAPKRRIASWLSINRDILEDRNREYNISLDDIRSGDLQCSSNQRENKPEELGFRPPDPPLISQEEG
jgi:hypothetical protein